MRWFVDSNFSVGDHLGGQPAFRGKRLISELALNRLSLDVAVAVLLSGLGLGRGSIVIDSLDNDDFLDLLGWLDLHLNLRVGLGDGDALGLNLLMRLRSCRLRGLDTKGLEEVTHVLLGEHGLAFDRRLVLLGVDVLDVAEVVIFLFLLHD